MKKIALTLTALAGFCATFGTAAHGIFNGITLLGVVVVAASFAGIYKLNSSPKPIK